MKQKIRLTESDLHRMVAESVNQIIQEEMDESWKGFFRGATSKVRDDVKGGLNKLGKKVGTQANDMYQGARRKVGSAASTIGNYARDAYDTASKYASDAYDKASKYANNAYDTASQYANDVKMRGMQESDKEDVENAIRTIEKLEKAQLINPTVALQCKASMEKALRAKQY